MSVALVGLAIAGPTLVTAPTAYATPQSAGQQKQVRTLIRQHLADSTGHNVSLQIGSTKAMASVKPCRHHPDVRIYGRGQHRDARVNCPGRGWQFYIPVTLQQKQTVVVAAHDLQQGKALKRSDLKVIREAGPEGSDLAHDLKSVIGQTLKAPISRGTPVSLNSLQGATRVHSGQDLTVRVESGDVVIKTTAVALQSGRTGQTILVKNPGSGKRYRVTVNSEGGAVYNLGN